MAIGTALAQAVVDLDAALARLGHPAIAADPGQAVETLVLGTDASWQVSADGRAWVQAMPYSAFYRHAGIWDATPGGWLEALHFRTAFVVPGEVRAARAEGGSDDDLLAFTINGTRIFGESTCYSDLLLRDTAITTATVVAGANTILAHARNIGGHSSFGAEVAVDFVPIPRLAEILAAVRGDGGRIVEGGMTAMALRGSDRADLVAGGGASEWLLGWGGADTLLGGNGDDWVDGGAGDDLLFGGSAARPFAPGSAGPASRDSLSGGAGDDWLVGSDGRDSLLGGAGADRIDGGAGNDRASGGGGNDTIRLGDGDDLLFHDASQLHEFGRGNDRIFGEDGNDRLHGGRGDDTLDGGAGADILNAGPGGDRMTGRAGSDTFQFRGAYGVDTITDFAAGDRLAVGAAINGLSAITEAGLLARLADGATGARLDLGGANAVIFEGLAADAVRDLLSGAIDLI